MWLQSKTETHTTKICRKITPGEEQGKPFGSIHLSV